jgi:ribokinase
MAGRVVVVGSLNADLVVRCERAPAAGETVAGSALEFVPGGKGANQAVAAARAGARGIPVIMVGCVGGDDFGRRLRASLRAAQVDDSGVREVATATGTALIVVEAGGENRIVLSAGANGEVRASDAARAALAAGDQVVLELEIPFDVVREVAREASRRGATVHLNAAPADPRALSLAGSAGHLIVNESEAALLAGRPVDGEAAERAAIEALRAAGFPRVTLTLGARGALHSEGPRLLRVAAPKVAVVDTTAAGDAFVGAWVAAECAGAPAMERLRRAVAAGSLAVTRAGAQPSLPRADEIERIAATLAVVG